MTKPLVLMLYNAPLLPKDHPDADSENTVVDISRDLTKVLTEEGFRVNALPLGSDPSILWTELKERPPEVVFNLFEGNLDNPETESFVAGLLEWSGIPYTGSPFPTLSLARAKHTTKYLLKGAKLPTADFMVASELPVAECTLDFPVIVKPAKQDASVGMDQGSVCTDQQQLELRVRYILATYGAPVIIEQYISGREFNVALMELPTLQALRATEIVCPEEKDGMWSILTYDGKWKSDAPDDAPAPPPVYPTDLPAATLRKMSRLAKQAYQLLGCRDYARVDFRLNPAGKLFILEVNPNPEISEYAGFAGCLGGARFSHREFIIKLVHQALSRRDLPKPTFSPIRPVETIGG